MTRKLAVLLAVVLAAFAAASLTVGLLYWALESFRRKPPRAPLPVRSVPNSPAPLSASSDRLPWH